jgi:hypothetical protein
MNNSSPDGWISYKSTERKANVQTELAASAGRSNPLPPR